MSKKDVWRVKEGRERKGKRTGREKDGRTGGDGRGSGGGGPQLQLLDPLDSLIVVVVVVVVRTACTRRHNYKVTIVRRRLGSPQTNRNVFSNRRNSPSSMSIRHRSGGKVFQIRGPAAEKLRSPKRVRVLGTMHVSTSAERRRRRNLSEEARMQSSAR